MNPGHFLVTGSLRSGTTLVEKLLCNHPAASVLHQPLQDLLVAVKAVFLASRGYPGERNPLGNLCLERRYAPADLANFLDCYTGASNNLIHLRADAGPPAGLGLRALLTWYWRCHAHRPDASLYGAKEVLAEEYIPHLLAGGIRVILVLRDPRDMLVSGRSGRGSDWVGAPRPVLFDLRNWRKSAAFALRYAEDPCLLVIKYEDLVSDPVHVLGHATTFLGLAPVPTDVLAQGLRSQDGSPWGGNSSFALDGVVSTAGVGRFRGGLAAHTLAYVEVVCGPEMAALGYRAETSALRDADAVLTSYEDEVPCPRAEFAQGYTAHPERVAEELRRLAIMRGDPPDPGPASLFVFPEILPRLRQGMP